MSIQTVGIVGAGTMGNGIAQACAVAGLKAVMVDISQAAVDKGLATIGKSLDRLVSKEKISEADKAAALARVVGSTRYEDLGQADLVIEAATENHPVKIKILQQLDQMLRPEVIHAFELSSADFADPKCRHAYEAIADADGTPWYGLDEQRDNVSKMAKETPLLREMLDVFVSSPDYERMKWLAKPKLPRAGVADAVRRK